MKFVKKIPDDSVNIGKKNPLVELLWMSGVVVLVLIVFYIASGMAIDKVIVNISAETEQKIWEKIIGDRSLIPNNNRTPEIIAKEAELQKLLDERILPNSPLSGRQFEIVLFNNNMINAGAVPPNKIIVFNGLLDSVQSENELAFILAHEVGHFCSRDHLRGLGRKLVFMVISGFIFGENNMISDYLAQSVSLAELNISRSQEVIADTIALDILVAIYSHPGGAADFFVRMSKKYPQKKYLVFLKTHPHPEERVRYLNEIMKKNGYKIQETKPLILN